jgi:hypothetical protein
VHVAGWYVTDVERRALAGPFGDPDAAEVGETFSRLYAERGGGCCDLALEWLDDDGTPSASPDRRS